MKLATDNSGRDFQRRLLRFRLQKAWDQVMLVGKGKQPRGLKKLVHPGPWGAAEVTRLRRTVLKVSRPRLSRMLGAGSWTIKEWEQGVSKPTGAAGKLLKLLGKYPAYGRVLELI